MQEVSNEWKNSHKKSLLNESFVEISLNISDSAAQKGATPTDNGAIYISNSSQITDGVTDNPIPYCTLEQNIWCLDGNRKAVPESDFGDNCYVSDVLSDDTCLFNGKRPVITLNFSKKFTKLIPGITITWSKTYGEFADTFSVIAYNGDSIVAETEVTLNRSVTSIIWLDIRNYNRIDIVVKKWCLPNHRARVEEVLIGLKKVYEKKDLFDYSHSNIVDPVSTSLPKNEIKFSIDNVDGEYNPYNTSGLDKYLSERQEINVKYGLKLDDKSIEWIKGGTFYLSEWYAKQNGITADFTARDMLEFMSNIYKDSITSPTSRKLYTLAQIVLESANLPKKDDGNDRWIIDKSLNDITTNAPLPEDTSAVCLQLIANAAKCVLYQDRDGIIHIEPLKSVSTDYEINSSNSYSKSEVTLSKPVKEVKVNVYTYASDLSSTTSEVTHSTGIDGETITIDNPLITNTEYAKSFAEWLATHLGHRATLDSSWRADVRLDPLDIVTNSNDYTNNIVRMTEVNFTYNGAFRGTGKGKVM